MSGLVFLLTVDCAELLQDMITEEEQLKEKMKQSTLEYKRELEVLYKDLDIQPRPVCSFSIL